MLCSQPAARHQLHGLGPGQWYSLQQGGVQAVCQALLYTGGRNKLSPGLQVWDRFGYVWCFQVEEDGAAFLNVMTNGGVGDVDIYVRRNEYPT